MSNTFKIQKQKQFLINTDTQRRCYNGCNFSEELVWSEWEDLEHNIPKNKIETRIQFWRSLNDYAVSQRGESAKCNFRKVST